MWTTSTLDNGIKVRDITVDTGKGGDALTVVQLTDIHIVWMNESDYADPVLAKTYQKRTWAWDYEDKTDHLDIFLKCINTFHDADQIVVTGDIYDFFTDETVVRVRDIFNSYDNVMASLGNHEVVKMMGEELGNGDWTAIVDKRLKRIDGNWVNDIYYSSKVLGDKVMLIQMDNGVTGKFWDVQVEKFSADLNRARANGYAVLLFYHIPIATLNSKDINSKCCGIQAGNTESTFNFCSTGAAPGGNDATGKICSLIFSNGDIIKGAFCGHKHSDFYTEIKATDPSGNPAYIPQYILAGAYVGNGQILRITVK